MQRKFTFFPALALLVLMQMAAIQTLHAQNEAGTDDDGFIVQILSPASIAKELVHGINGLDCNWVGSAYGPDLTADLCGQVVWAQDDSLGCTPLQDMTGKIALIRRGGCNFSIKMYNATKAHAIAGIIVNHYANDAIGDGPCSTFSSAGVAFGGMAGTDTFAAAVTIPSIFIHRQTGEEIDGALANGEDVNVCFSLPRFYSATGPYHYATPVTQVDTLNNLSVNYTNRDSVLQTGVELRAEITEPGGNVVTLVTTSDVTAGQDSLYYFPPYLPPSVVGEFNVLFTNNKYTESRDSLRYKFIQTEYTFATDNYVLDPGGIGTSNVNFVSGDFVHQEGALCITGPNGGNATYATFGIANIDSVFVEGVPPGGTANDIFVFLYDGDADEDGTPDISSSFDDLQQVGYGTYTMTGNEVDGVLVDAALGDFLSGGPVELKPRHPYYVSLYYNGLESGLGRDIRFSNTKSEWTYINFPTTPLTIGNGTALTLFSGWSGAEVINRLQLEGYVPSVVGVNPGPLFNSEVIVHPNPANDVVRVNLKLEAISEVVTLTLFDWQGRVVTTQVARNMQEGQLSLNVQSLPTGTYVLWVRTAEGSTARKVSISH